MPPANKLVVFPIPFLISLLQTSLKEQGAIALTRVYSWGWGEGSGHCCCHHQLPRMNCPGDISEVRVHSCILGCLNLPSIRVFSNESALHIRRPKYWSFSFNISPSSKHSGLIAFKMDWSDLPCTPRDSQESSTAQFKDIINSSVLSFLYSPALTFIHDYWRNQSFD